MSLKKYSSQEIAERSMIELANLILIEKNKATDFREVYDEIVELKGFTKKQKEEYISQFYTDLNIDGRFMTMGSNLWGLKSWYTVEQFDEEITAAPKKKKKKKKAATKRKAKVKEPVEEDLDEEDLDFDDVDLDEELDDYDDDDLDDASDSDDYDDFDDDESDDTTSDEDDDEEDED
ncbi:DNA-directed RNA polymerase subunit delta [Aquibacillus rhizosphaerae]|uniref:Probable DNA-directed RNA polymerase subunit delta n=1 Tax=Aquibacillus rhizosphaerae TaxID=3051431 RepID=A0ABT7L0A0_9BACI|nr:DNA-directed RNA polymerase subunit delta [Aquibacillus sp. LR5S19]MDL4839174.1 DNA-directed RNA polymerase subunit delta [Aquibacillus sp. LR5S19]